MQCTAGQKKDGTKGDSMVGRVKRSDAEALKKAVWEWEDKNLINYNGYVLKGGKNDDKSVIANMRRRGYDAVRISPQTTTKNGLKYRAVYGAIIEPNYRLPKVGNKYHPIVTWTKQGFIKAGTKTGTTVFTTHGDMFVASELKSKLMVKK